MTAIFRFLGVFIGILLFHFTAYGQSPGTNSSQEEPMIYIEGFNYPTFEPYTHYGWFRVNFGITPTTEFSVGGDHYRNVGADRFAIPIELRQYIGEKIFVIGGYEREWDLLNEGKGKPNPIPVDEMYFGVGHDVSPNMMMDIRIARPLGEQRFYKVGLEGVRTRLEVGTCLKF